MNLSEQLIECVAASGLNDDHKLSAIGMARVWVERREAVKVAANPADLYPGRDKLAVALVAIFEAVPGTNEEYVEALSEARKEVNAPYQNDWRGGRSVLSKPKEQKKAREAAK